jgi:hypothetical protein
MLVRHHPVVSGKRWPMEMLQCCFLLQYSVLTLSKDRRIPSVRMVHTVRSDVYVCPSFQDDLETFYSPIETFRAHRTFSTAVHSHKVSTPHIDVYTLVGIPPSEEAWF